MMQRVASKIFLTGAVLWSAFFAPLCLAASYPLPPKDVDLIGDMQSTVAQHEDTLLDIARRFNIGQNEILHANPKIDRWLPGEGTKVLLPTRYILPDAPRTGIVLNIAEMRLYYYPPGKAPATVITHPVSIGRMDWSTPLGTTHVVTKTKDPVWRPPESIKQEHAAAGEILPDVVPAGPDNPLGRYAMRLAIPGYLIHSTNKPFGIGMQVTHGCVRMYPEDIERLFPQVKVGTPVHIVNQPIKLGWFMDTLYIEVHPPLEDAQLNYEKALKLTLDLIESQPTPPPLLDGYALKKALQEQRGIPIAISRADKRYATASSSEGAGKFTGATAPE